MFNNFLHYCFPSAVDSLNEPVVTTDAQIEVECKEFLPEVYDTWIYLQKLSIDSTHFREIHDLYKYERSENNRRSYFEQLKVLDDNIYKLSLTIHQRIQTLEKIAQPTLDEFRRNSSMDQPTKEYIPAYIRIARNQLNSVKSSFQRLISQYNTDAIEFQNELKESLRHSKTMVDSYQQISRATADKIKSLFNSEDEHIQLVQEHIPSEQQSLSTQEEQIIDLEARLESVRILKERIRQMK